MTPNQLPQLHDRLRTFNQEVIDFIENLSEEEWRRTCESEKWTIGVVARHIGVQHYSTIELAKSIIAGEPLPDMNKAQMDRYREAHARKHADCTRGEVLSILNKKGAALVEYVAGISDADLRRSVHIEELGGDWSVGQLLEKIILESGREHLDSMRKTVRPS